ncbi:MAG TPA: hypothetical protein VNP04_07190 [Alphaproteobacteria bacterium]|nr:hypothetical protein [Alphaproteobacteria bacterium]
MPESDDRLARLEVLLEQMDKRLVEGFAGVHRRLDDLQARLGSLEHQVNTRLLAIEGRLTLLEAQKADKSTLNHWGVTLAALIGAATALVKLWP